jgi:hypothetical protein
MNARLFQTTIATIALFSFSVGGASALTPDNALSIILDPNMSRDMTAGLGVHGNGFFDAYIEASCDADRTLNQITFVLNGTKDPQRLPRLSGGVDGQEAMSPLPAIDPKTLTTTLRFKEPVVIKACKSAHIFIYADIPANAKLSTRYELMVEFPSDILSDATSIFGNFPVKGRTLRVINAPVDFAACIREARALQSMKERSQARAQCRSVQHW